MKRLRTAAIPQPAQYGLARLFLTVTGLAFHGYNGIILSLAVCDLMNPEDVLISFSLALYSTWFYHKPTRCLFDAGEGVATTMGKKVYAIQNIFLSHGHEDHIAGISNLVNIRNLTAGPQDKSLNIYYPRHDPWIDAMFQCIERKHTGLLRYPIYVQPLDPGDEVVLEDAKRPTRVVAFDMEHAQGQLCLGFQVEQERRLLDPLTGESVCRYCPVFFYTGDGYRPHYSPHGRCEIAVHEATFFARDAGEAAARVAHRHCTVEKAVDWGASEDVKMLILCHISDRYHVDDVIETARRAKLKSHFRGDLYVAYKDRIIPVEPRSDEASEA